MSRTARRAGIEVAASEDDIVAFDGYLGAGYGVLGEPEREAIQLARELKADLLLVDDLRPRRIAMSLGITVIGTIGILERAARQRLIDLEGCFRQLRQIDFYVSDKLLAAALRRHMQQP